MMTTLKREIENDNLDWMWTEYEYRHGLVWKIVFQSTTAIVALSIVPYLEVSVRAGYVKLLPLPIAVALASFTYMRMKQEFSLLNSIKYAYLKATRDGYSVGDSKFERHTKIYLLTMVAGLVLHMIFVIAASANEGLADFVGITLS